MNVFKKKQIWIYAASYMAFSMLAEIFLLVIVGWEIPADNTKIAFVLLTLIPVIAGILAGYKKLKVFITITILVIIFTFLFSSIFGMLTGNNPPIIIRFCSGLLAAIIAEKLRH